MSSSTKSNSKRRPLSRSYVFFVVCLATFLLGAFFWKPADKSFHIQSKIIQTLPLLPLANESTPAESSDALLDAFIENHKLTQEPTLAHLQVLRGTVTTTNLSDDAKGHGIFNTIFLTATTDSNPQKSTVTLNYVSPNAHQAMTIANNVTQEYADFVSERIQYVTAQIETKHRERVAGFKTVAESAEKNFYEFVTKRFAAPQNNKTSQQNNSLPNDSAGTPIVSAESPIGTNGLVEDSKDLVVNPHSEKSGPGFPADRDDIQTAIWHALNEQLTRAENQLSNLLIDLQETHPRVQQLKNDIAQIHRDLKSIEPPPPIAARPPTPGLATHTGSDLKVNPLAVAEQNNGLSQPRQTVDNHSINNNALTADQETFQQLKNEMERARRQYDEALGNERQTKNEHLATQLQSIPLFHLEPARVIHVLQPRGASRLGFLLLLGIGSGTVISLLLERRHQDFVADTERACQLIPSPILAEIPRYNNNNTIRSAYLSKYATARLVTRCAEIVVIVFLLTACLRGQFVNSLLGWNPTGVTTISMTSTQLPITSFPQPLSPKSGV